MSKNIGHHQLIVGPTHALDDWIELVCNVIQPQKYQVNKSQQEHEHFRGKSLLLSTVFLSVFHELYSCKHLVHKEELNLNNFSYIFVIIFNNRLSLGQVSKRFLLQSTTSTTSFRATCGHGDCDQAVRSAHYEDPIHIQRQAKDLLIVARHIQYKNQTKNNLKQIQYTF